MGDSILERKLNDWKTIKDLALDVLQNNYRDRSEAIAKLNLAIKWYEATYEEKWNYNKP